MPEGSKQSIRPSSSTGAAFAFGQGNPKPRNASQVPASENLPSASGLKPRGRQARPPRASNTLSPAVADETLGKRPLPFTDATNAFQRRALENIMDPTGPPEHIAITPALPAAAGHSGLVDDPSFLQMAPAASLQGSYEQDDQDEIEEGPVGMAVDSSQREEMVPPAAAPPAPLHIQDPQGQQQQMMVLQNLLVAVNNLPHALQGILQGGEAHVAVGPVVPAPHNGGHPVAHHNEKPPVDLVIEVMVDLVPLVTYYPSTQSISQIISEVCRKNPDAHMPNNRGFYSYMRYVMRCDIRNPVSQSVTMYFPIIYKDFQIDGGQRLFVNGELNRPVADTLLQNKGWRQVGNEPYGQQCNLQLLHRTGGRYSPVGAVPEHITEIKFLPAAHIAYIEMSVERILRGEDINKIDEVEYHQLGLAIKQAYGLSETEKVGHAAYAGHHVLNILYPHRFYRHEAVLAPYAAALTAPQANAAQAFGRHIAVSLIGARLDDGFSDYVPFTPSPPGGTPGAYQFTPGQVFTIYPQLATTQTFVITNPASFDLGPPYALDSDAYAADLAEVFWMGGKESNRTQYQNDTIYFWADGLTTSSLAGHFNSIAQKVLLPSLGLDRTAEVFAQINVAAFDTSVAGWGMKYKYRFWRPLTAIRQGTGNPALAQYVKADWNNELGPAVSPEFAPEYASGAQHISAGISGILSHALGTDVVSFTIGTEFPNLPLRNFSSLKAAVDDVNNSRIWGGVHFRKSGDIGTELGYNVANSILKNWGKATFGLAKSPTAAPGPTKAPGKSPSQAPSPRGRRAAK